MTSAPITRRSFAGLGLGLGAYALTGAPSIAATAELGPPIGSKALDIGTPQDEHGKPRTLDSLMGDKGVVLFFFRAASWCPFCQAQMIDLNSGVAEIAKRGYKLAGISYETPDKQAEFIEKRGIKYDLLCDPGSKVIDRWGLRDPQYGPDSFAYGVPRPVIFIIDRKGVIKSKLYEETYTKRPPVGLVIETLDKLAKS